MAGWRLGWCCGAKKLIYPLEKFKSFLDYGSPTFMQLAGVAALTGSDSSVRETAAAYERRMKKLSHGLNKIGWEAPETKATMYLWVRLPDFMQKEGSLSICEKLLKDTGVAISPGAGFGKYGEGYARISLVTHDRRFHDALLRITEFTKNYKK
jgi:aspartate/methionine/tyrosine aminotransferase